MPVALPPGRLKLATTPNLTGSSTLRNTIGVVAAAALACSNEGRSCKNHSHLTADQIGRQFRQSLEVVLRPAIFDPYVLSFNEARFHEAPSDCGPERPGQVWRSVMEEPDYRRRRLLRARTPCVGREQQATGSDQS